MQTPDTEAMRAWRAMVEKDLKGVPFDKALLAETPEGIALQPLYTHVPWDPGLPGAAPFARGVSATPLRPRVCMRVDAGDAEALADDLAGGADALWVDADQEDAIARGRSKGVALIVEAFPGAALIEADVYAVDPLGHIARGALDPAALGDALTALGNTARSLRGSRVARVSTLAVHAAGADAADELAFALSAALFYLRAMCERGMAVPAAAASLTAQVAVGRDTFGELCKLRALRVCWHKLLSAAGARDTSLRALHAVCSTRTVTQRDPWVNMLRVTTEVFSAMLGGAEFITPRAFDASLDARSAMGRRVARNTALVLRDESHLARVVDPAGGSYYLEHRTEALAREAWSRFTAMEREGGAARLLCDGTLRARYESAWAKRASLLSRRKESVLGVSEFANLDESLPARPAMQSAPPAPALVPHRDAERFEALRDLTESTPTEALLLTLGPPSEHRARLGFAQGFFSVAGVRTMASATPSGAPLACLCGSDERYAEEAVSAVKALREAGCRRIALAGRPGALEPALREAGVTDFIYLGCDVVETLGAMLGGAR